MPPPIFLLCLILRVCNTSKLRKASHGGQVGARLERKRFSSGSLQERTGPRWRATTYSLDKQRHPKGQTQDASANQSTLHARLLYTADMPASTRSIIYHSVPEHSSHLLIKKLSLRRHRIWRRGFEPRKRHFFCQHIEHFSFFFVFFQLFFCGPSGNFVRVSFIFTGWSYCMC